MRLSRSAVTMKGPRTPAVDQAVRSRPWIAPTNSLFYLRKQVADTLLETRLIFLEIFQTHLSDAWSKIERMAYVANRYRKGDFQEFKPEARLAKIVDNSLWRNLPIYLNSSEVLMQQCWNEPSFWRPEFPKTAYDQLVALNRQSVLFLTVLQNHLSESDRQRNEIAKRGERLLIDEVRKELTDLREALINAMDELAHIIRTNMLSKDMRDPAKAPDPLRADGSFINRHVTPNSNKCKILLNAMHIFDINSKKELRKRLQDGTFLDNAELFAFHAIRSTLQGLAKTIVECDILTWGGDARWVVALRIEASNHIQSVNGPIY
ncbi:MAG: hypothetical protein CMH85_03465 [Novosphingobium sp.]|nr:hypothetical protein [Novosphingobium sp.]